MKEFPGLYCIHLELTSKCNKNCWMCGRRKIDREYPDIASNYGDMDYQLLEEIASQIPEGIVIQFHNNGEPLLYPRLGEALKLFNKQIRCLDTNAKLLLEKKDEIINNLDTMSISIIPNDSEQDEQYEIVKEFIKIKEHKKPRIIFRLIGAEGCLVKRRKRWEELGELTIHRILHDPMGSFNYEKRIVVPEIGICLEVLNHLAIDRFGNASICVRFDPEGKGVLGNLKVTSLWHIWNGERRKKWKEMHRDGRRKCVPLCKNCEFWGIPGGKYA